MRSVAAGVDTVGILGPAVVVAASDMADMADMAGSVFVGVVAAELGMVDIAAAVVAGLGKVDSAVAVAVVLGTAVAVAVAVGLGMVGTADVDRHRLVVPWLPSYTVVQFVFGFLNNRSCLGWSNHIVGDSNPHRTVFG